MWGRLGPRFALEAAFLILLAVGLGIADQDWVVIVAVMAGGWALVSLIELVASRRPPWEAVPGVTTPPREAEPPVAAGDAAPPPAPEAPAWAEPQSPVAAPPEPALEAEQAPVASGSLPPAVVEPAAPVEPVGAAEPAVSEDTQEVPPEEAVVEPSRPRRRWFRRSRTEEQQEVPEPPKHVRKLDPDADGELAERIGEPEGAEAPAAADSGDDRS